MMKRILPLALSLLPFLLSAQLVSVLAARAKPVGSMVTVRGIVTSGEELGKIRYLQDGTAGIAAYPGAGSAAGFEAAVTPGDSVEVTGTLVSYQGLLEITPISSYTVLAENRPLPAPKLLSLSDLSENYESQLVGFECVVFAAGGSPFSTGSFSVSDGDGHVAEVYLRSGHPLTGEEIPGTPVFLTSILSDFNGFQLLPRNTADFSASQCFYFINPLSQTNITTSGFTVSWETNLPASSKIHFGTTTALGSTVNVPGGNTVNLSGLEPGSVYWVQVESLHNGSTIFSKTTPFATRSLSSGDIKVFFNHSIDPAYANGFSPDGQTNTAVVAETIARINAAQQTLDVAMYNNGRADLTNALKDAHNRGVRVRYVATIDASNNALSPLPPFPVIFGNNEAIMHDKFLVIDADLPDKAWVMSGSLNWTNQNINTDFNNTLFIQDQSLARGYEIEFEEMWGSETAQPNELNSRFGSSKRDNTPHHYIIGNRKVESWFSPSDRTTDHIVETVYNASDEALFATFSFTKNEIGDALVDVFSNNIAVRGMIENISDPGVEIDYLTSVGIDCRPHPITGELHHKYGVFDANGADPVVLTGSHNWTFAAETVNDENTLIIHDYKLASLYKAEFERRWQEVTVSTRAPEGLVLHISPNPVADVLYWQTAEDVQLIRVQNVLGQVVQEVQPEPGTHTNALNVSALNRGSYFVTMRSSHGVSTVSFQKI